ncbi:MAG: sensor histidine kinase [Alphaproteobacteria bacterium PA4]|nr:MAG: sensor histidine kinase [Alphaproteobacteria bacterium PA4]
MAWDTGSTRSNAASTAAPDRGEVQEWRRGLGFGSLRARIFAVNIIAVIVLAIMLLYLDTVRSRLLDERTDALRNTAVAVAGLAGERPPGLARLNFERGTRLRLYGRDGAPVVDNWADPATRRFTIDDPQRYSWRRASAKFIDRALERIASFRALPPYREAVPDGAGQWPEIAVAVRAGQPATRLRRAEDGSFIITAAAAVPGGGAVHLVDSADDLARILRDERLTSFWLLLSVTVLTVGLSSYLARTIVRPLRMLAIAAHRVRLGRSREVIVPRLPDRRDEIGALARAVSDMSLALRLQIDATEAFAADVAHELKNPLASLRSAVDTLEQVQQPDLRERLLLVIRDDVARLDRLITDISDASRLDAELSRSRFEPLDAGALAAGLVAAYQVAGLPAGLAIAYSPPAAGAAKVEGDPARLAQVLRNLIDNALSFSPPGGTVLVSADTGPGRVQLRVEDEGPGVPAENRGDVFKRFYSQRPEAEDFGRHSGLGLSIAGAIVQAHGGSIRVTDRPQGQGAMFIVELPAA